MRQKKRSAEPLPGVAQRQRVGRMDSPGHAWAIGGAGVAKVEACASQGKPVMHASPSDSAVSSPALTAVHMETWCDEQRM